MSFLFYRNININAKARDIYLKAHDKKNKHSQSNHNKCLRRKALNLDYHLHTSYLLKEYLIFANICDIVVISNVFSNFILLCIVAAGALVGIETYDGMSSNIYVNIANNIVVFSFLSEIVLKIISEGVGPQWYFFGEDWKWNWFDLLIVLFSFDGVLPVGGRSVKLLRLLRLARLAKVFRKVTELRMIIMGLLGGLKSVFYILILMMLIFYVYAIAGIIFFRDNDPFHFDSIEKALVVLLQVASLDNWGDVLFVNYFGCKNWPYPHIVQSENQENSGGIKYCASPQPQEALSVTYFISFIFLCSFCCFSLFIGTIMLAMAQSILDMRVTQELARQKREKEKAAIMEKEYMENRDKQHSKVRRVLKMLQEAFQGEDVTDIQEDINLSWRNPLSYYSWMSLIAIHITESKYFQRFYILVILAAGVLVGFTTDPSSINYQFELDIANIIIQYLFLLEIVLKLLTFEFKWWNYFKDEWNVFDFIVVMVAFVPATGGLTLILRLLRLLRVMKLMRAIRQLQIIIYALIKGAQSMFFISIICFLFFYVYAIAGVTLFGENDPIHFGTLGVALVMLFDMATFDGWTEIFFINAYGCAEYPDYPNYYGQSCDPSKSSAQFALSAIYWAVFVILGGLVLLSLFIGLVNLTMSQAQFEANANAAIDKRAHKIAEVEGLSPDQVSLYKEIFSLIDISRSERIGREEMKLGLKIGGLQLEKDDFEKLWIKVDKDGSNNISFSEFLEYMIALKSEIAEEETKLDRYSEKRRFTFLAGKKSTKEYMVSRSESEKNVSIEKEDLALDQLLGLDNGNMKSFTKQQVVPINDSNISKVGSVPDNNILDSLLGLSNSSTSNTSLSEEIKTPRASKNNNKITPFYIDTGKEENKIDTRNSSLSNSNHFVSTPDSADGSQQQISQFGFTLDSSRSSPIRQPEYTTSLIAPGFNFSLPLSNNKPVPLVASPNFSSQLSYFSSSAAVAPDPSFQDNKPTPTISSSSSSSSSSSKPFGFPKTK